MNPVLNKNVQNQVSQNGFLYCFDVSLIFSGTVSMHVRFTSGGCFPSHGCCALVYFSGGAGNPVARMW